MATKDVELRLVISAVNHAGKELGRVGEQLRSVSARAKDLGTSSAAAGTKGARGLKKFGQALDSLKPKFEALGRASDKMVSMGMQLGQVGAGLMASIALPVLRAASFEKAMSGVRAVTAGTSEEFVELSKKAKTLGATTEWTAKQVANAMAFLGMAGMDAAEALDAVGPSLLLASAGGLELAEAADIATNIMKGMNLETSELVHVTDVLAYAASNANTSVGDLGLAFSYVAGLVQSAGMSIEMAASMLGGLADAGYRATRGGTALRGIIVSLAKVMPPAQKAFDRLGVQVSKNADGTIDYLQTLADLNEAGADTEDWITIFKTSFGAAASILALNAERLTENAEAMESVSGTAKEMAGIRLDNLWGAFQLLTAAVDGLATAMGDPLLGPLKKVLEYTAEALSATTKWVEENSALAGVLGTVVGGLGGLLVVVGAILIPLGLLGKLVAMVGVGLGTWVVVAARVGKALVSLKTALAGVNIMATALGRAFVALGLTMAAWDIYRMIDGFIQWQKAEGEAEEATKRLREQGALLVEKFEEFKDIPLPETVDLLRKTKEQLKGMNAELIKSHLYWTGIRRELEARAEEKKFWLFETQGAKAAKEELAGVNEKLQGIREARNQLVKAMRAGEIEAEVSVGLVVDPKQLTELQSEILGAMDEVGEGITKSLSKSFEVIDTDPMVRRLEAAQIEISRNTELSGLERARLIEKIEKDAASRRLVLIQTSLDDALFAWSRYGEKQVAVAEAALEAGLVNEEQYAGRLADIAEDVTQKKIEELAKVRQFLERDLNKSLAVEQDYAEKIKDIQEDITDFHKTVQEKVRDVWRKGLTEEEAYYDRVKELQEKLAKARALAPDQYEEAKALFKEVESAASSLVGEIKKGDAVVVTEQKTIEMSIGLLQQAYAGLYTSGKLVQTETKSRLVEQQDVTRSILDSLDRVTAKFDLLTEKMARIVQVRIEVDTRQLDDALDKMQVLGIGGEVQLFARQEGGMISAAGGGLMPSVPWRPTPAGRKVPGAGTKDSVFAMLAPKEYVLCADAVREYGLAFVQGINRRVLDLGALYKFQAGGSIMDAVKSPPPRLVQLSQILPSTKTVVGGAGATTVNRKDFNININMNGGRTPKLSGRARRLLDQLSDEMDVLTARGASFG